MKEDPQIPFFLRPFLRLIYRFYKWLKKKRLQRKKRKKLLKLLERKGGQYDEDQNSTNSEGSNTNPKNSGDSSGSETNEDKKEKPKHSQEVKKDPAQPQNLEEIIAQLAKMGIIINDASIQNGAPSQELLTLLRKYVQDFQNLVLSGATLAELSKFLEDLPRFSQILKIDFRGTQIEDLFSVLAVLSRTCPFLEILNLSNNMIGHHFPIEYGMHDLITGLSHLSQALLSHNLISDLGSVLGLFSQACPDIKHLDLGRNEIHHIGHHHHHAPFKCLELRLTGNNLGGNLDEAMAGLTKLGLKVLHRDVPPARKHPQHNGNTPAPTFAKERPRHTESHKPNPRPQSGSVGRGRGGG